jgi:hypothetical protein
MSDSLTAMHGKHDPTDNLGDRNRVLARDLIDTFIALKIEPSHAEADIDDRAEAHRPGRR